MLLCVRGTLALLMPVVEEAEVLLVRNHPYTGFLWHYIKSCITLGLFHFYSQASIWFGFYITRDLLFLHSTRRYLGCNRKRKVSLQEEHYNNWNIFLTTSIIMWSPLSTTVIIIYVISSSGETVLHKAASLCHRTICHYLVEAGASLMKTDLQVSKMLSCVLTVGPHYWHEPCAAL